MNRQLFFAMGICCTVLLASCKSQESAYRKAYEQAQENVQNNDSEQVVAVNTNTADETVTVTPVTTTTTTTSTNTKTDVRTIDGGVTVVNGEVLKAYSVVVGSFVTQSNAEVLMNQLRGEGYGARVVKTNETINGRTGWYRVIASSFDDKSSAVASRNELAPRFAGAWLLFSK